MIFSMAIFGLCMFMHVTVAGQGSWMKIACIRHNYLYDGVRKRHWVGHSQYREVASRDVLGSRRVWGDTPLAGEWVRFRYPFYDTEPSCYSDGGRLGRVARRVGQKAPG